MTLLASDDELANAQELLHKFKTQQLSADALRDPATHDRLWNARSLRDAIVHPDTGEKIPWPCRMSAFTPVNVPIVAGMLYSAPTVFNTILWQWVNQSVRSVFFLVIRLFDESAFHFFLSS
jgi:hypothetical protein